MVIAPLAPPLVIHKNSLDLLFIRTLHNKQKLSLRFINKENPKMQKLSCIIKPQNLFHSDYGSTVANNDTIVRYVAS